MATALIVDDDLVSRLVLHHMMVAQGFTVLEASSVDEALEVLHDGVDLIVCDYQMPERDGLDLLDAIEGALPFVLLTGVVDRTELEDERVENVTAYLTKPVSSDELATVIDAVLGSDIAHAG